LGVDRVDEAITPLAYGVPRGVRSCRGLLQRCGDVENPVWCRLTNISQHGSNICYLFVTFSLIDNKKGLTANRRKSLFLSQMRETGVEPARVSPLDPKCRKITFLLHRAHRTFGWQPLIWQRETTNRHWRCLTSEWALDVPECVRSVSGLRAGFSVQRAKHGIAVACILIGHSLIASDPRQPAVRIL
jgi:hypothetical protein